MTFFVISARQETKSRAETGGCGQGTASDCIRPVATQFASPPFLFTPVLDLNMQ